MKKEENKHITGRWITRLSAIMLAVIVAVSYLPVDFSYATGKSKKSSSKSKTTTSTSEKPIREVHKVNVGGKKYCFFVTHNVVMTPEEVASFGDDDEKLTDEVLKRSGLYMKEANCKLTGHKAITPKEWKKKGGSLSLSSVEVYVPDDDEGTIDEEVEETKPSESPDGDGAADSGSGDNASDAGDGDGSDTGDGDGSDTGDGDGTDAGDGDGTNTGDGDGADAGDGDGTDAGDGDGTDAGDGDDADTPDEGEPDTTPDTSGGTLTEVEAVEALRMAAPSDGEPVRLYMDLIITAETSKKSSSKEPKKYSTFKKKSPNSPKLIYVVVATEKDAALGEEICKEEKKPENKGSEPRGVEDIEEPEEQLPEFKTIEMVDRSGGPLEPTLKDGDTVTLEWKEPGIRTDSEGNNGLFEHKWAIPALGALAVVLAAALVLILRKRRDVAADEE